MQPATAVARASTRRWAMLAALTFVLPWVAEPAFAEARGWPGITEPPRTVRTALDETTPDGRPTIAGLALLRAHTRGRVVRLQLGDTLLLVRNLRADSLGVAFDPAPRVARPSPVPWSAIAGLETRRTHRTLGIVIGTLLATFAGAKVADAAGSDPGPGIIVVFAFPPAGALLGGLVGNAIPDWRHEWPPGAPR